MDYGVDGWMDGWNRFDGMIHKWNEEIIGWMDYIDRLLVIRLLVRLIV